MMATSSGCGICPWSCSGKVGAYVLIINLLLSNFNRRPRSPAVALIAMSGDGTDRQA